MPFYFYRLDPTIIILIPAIIFSLVAQASVSSAFNKWSRVSTGTGITGAEAASRMMQAAGLRYIGINQIRGNLSDNYDPRSKSLNLSQSVYGVDSVAAVGVACHEVGHAIQHQENYAPLKIRNAIVPVVNFASRISWVLIIIGLLLLFARETTSTVGNVIFDIGVICFVAVIAFHLITLPVEFNASRRAVKYFESSGIIMPDRVAGAKSVLRAAAMTYVAALAVAVANLLRILAIRGRD